MSAVLGHARPLNIPNWQLISVPRPQPRTLIYFLALSLALHALLLLLHFADPARKTNENAASSLQVVLVNSKSARRPLKADALAQASLDGGGNTDAKAVATTPFPLQEDAEPQP